MKVLLVYRNDYAGYSIQRCFRPLEPFFISSGIDLHTLKLPSKRAFPHNLLWDILFLAFNLFFHKYDIVHITGGCPHTMFIRPLCKLLGVKVVSTIHDLGFYRVDDYSIKNRWHYYIGVASLKKADYLVFISESSKIEAMRLVDINNVPKSIIGDPVDPRFVFISHKLNLECPIILHVGTHPRKNLEGTINALAGRKYKLRIIGIPTQKQIEALNRNKVNYSFIANINDEEIVQEYANCDLVSFPTFYEGFGMPIIEAQMTGRPIITSNISPMKEVAGYGAVLVNPNDVNSIREGYDHAIMCYDRIVENGRINAQRFIAKNIATEYMDIYRSLLK